MGNDDVDDQRQERADSDASDCLNPENVVDKAGSGVGRRLSVTVATGRALVSHRSQRQGAKESQLGEDFGKLAIEC